MKRKIIAYQRTSGGRWVTMPSVHYRSVNLFLLMGTWHQIQVETDSFDEYGARIPIVSYEVNEHERKAAA